MTSLPDLKAQLRACIDQAKPDGTYDDAVIDEIHVLMQQLAEISPIPRPLDEQGKVAGPWGSYFAQFGPKHTAGKPIEHVTSFKLLSFGKFPDKPMKMLSIEQEICHQTKAYNNVQVIEPVGGGLQAYLIVYGRYAISEDNPKRYQVEFYRIALVGANGETEEELRAAFDFDDSTSLDVGMKPPTLHSDVVFCDEDMRINFGSMGGFYVMNRNHHSGYSVDFA